MAADKKHDDKPCPNCGHCPTCGKSNRGSYWPPNYWPPYRWQPQQFWYSSSPNYAGSSSRSGLSHASNAS